MKSGRNHRQALEAVTKTHPKPRTVNKDHPMSDHGKNKHSINYDDFPALIRTILESYFWLPDIKTMERYERLHDDHDGTRLGQIQVMFDPNGDAYVSILGDAHERSPTLRFRMPGSGGGLSPRTRVALLILAEAIRLDEKYGRHMSEE